MIRLTTVRIGRLLLINSGANFIELTTRGIISIDRVPGRNFIDINQGTFKKELVYLTDLNKQIAMNTETNPFIAEIIFKNHLQFSYPNIV